MFRDESVDLVYACHVLEHIPRNELKKVLTEWRRVLRPGGTFRFSVPDFDALIEVYRKAGRDIAAVEAQIMGERPPHDDHHSIWNESYARSLLTGLGFDNVHRWEPAKASLHDFEDRASASLSVGGQRVPISLNLEASRR